MYVRYHVAQVALENGFSDTEGYVRPDVEERPPKLLHRHGVHVRSHSQRRKPRHPRLIIGLHGLE